MDYRKRLVNEQENIRTLDIFTPANRKLLNGFIDTCKSKGLTDQRITFYLSRMKKICELHKKDFKKWTKEDVEITMRKINELNYKPHTIDAFKTTFKVFFRWLYDLDRSDPAPKIVSWLVKESPHNELRKEDLLTRGEIDRLIGATLSPKWKCVMAIMASGARPSEIFGIKLKDVTDEGDYIKIYVKGKTKKKLGERSVYVGFYIKGHQEHVRNWLKTHPDKDNPEALLALEMSNENQHKSIRIFREKAGIKKKVWPYLFRHTFGTWAYGNYNSAHARRLMGHAAGSKMESVYCHLSEDDIVDTLMGKKKAEVQENPETVDKNAQLWAKFEHENMGAIKELFFNWAESQGAMP